MDGLRRGRALGAVRAAPLLVAALALLAAACRPAPGADAVALARDDAAGALTVLVGGREAVVFRYGPDLDLPHYWPLRSPSGRSMLVQKTEPYPHHRSFWFADTVRLEGGGAGEGEGSEARDSSFYNALTSGVPLGGGDFGPPFRDRVRLVSFTRLEAAGGSAEVAADLVWETDGRPVLDEKRSLAVRGLGRGEYLLDLTFTLVAAHGDVAFKSDDVHYAWPYLRLDPAFSGERGGRITSDSGAEGQEATNMKPARWIDCSNTVDGVTEGLAVFQFPDGAEHRFLTREYGTFGPRRPDDRSGRPFTLRKGQTLAQRVGVLVHRGDAVSGRVRERYEEYASGARRPAGGRAMGVVEEAGAGALTVVDGGKPVLTYRHGDRLPAGVDPKYARSSYIHPLYSLDGAPLTEDFPADHPHHHGLFWAWPSVVVRGVATQSWHPAEPALRQRFVRWAGQEVGPSGVRLVTENAWTLGGRETVVEETVALTVHPASALGRAIDVEITLRPLDGPVELRGAAESDKGYGGLCLRGAALLEGAAMTTDEGPLEGDSAGRPFRWADLSAGAGGGIAVFVPPGHPGFPLTWLVRNSYAGILNPCWPGLQGATVAPGAPAVLRYRVYVHRGDAASGRVARAYEAYAAGGRR